MCVSASGMKLQSSFRFHSNLSSVFSIGSFHVRFSFRQTWHFICAVYFIEQQQAPKFEPCGPNIEHCTFCGIIFLFYFFKALDVIFWLIWNSSIWFWARRLHFTDCKLNFRITFPPHFGVQMIKNNCPKHVRSRKRMIITCKKSWRIKSTQGWNGFLFRFLNLLAIVIESIVVGSICINKMITKAHKLIEARLLLFNRYEIGLNLS